MVSFFPWKRSPKRQVWEEKKKTVSHRGFILHLVVTSLELFPVLTLGDDIVDMWQVVYAFISSFLFTSLALAQWLTLHENPSFITLEGLQQLSFCDFHIVPPSFMSAYSWNISHLKKIKYKGSAFMLLMLPVDVCPQWLRFARSCLTTRAKPRTSWTWRRATLSSSWKR